MSAIPKIEGLEAVYRQLMVMPPPVRVDECQQPQKYELRDYQQRALHEIREAIAAGKHSIMVCSPTGSGKGVMLSDIINRCHEKGSTVLFLVHRQEILAQVSAYLSKWGIEHGIIKSGIKHEDHHPVQLASFQTIHRRMDNPYIRQADVVIIDEAHHAVAVTYLKVIEKFKKKVVLGFSATPSRQNGLGLGNLFEILIQVATIQELTDQGYLAPVRYFAPVRPDLSKVKQQNGDYALSELEPVMLDGGLVGDLVGHWLKFGQGRKTMVFATGVKHSIAICDQFRRVGILAEHVDGKTPREDREAIVDRFKKGLIQIIVNCQVFTEGVDVPDIGCVILARPTKSLPMYLQMVGRGMRMIPGKVDMILIDHAGAVYEHGFAHEVAQWELSSTDKTSNRQQEKRRKKESEPICCPNCSSIYTGRLKCPDCGHIPTVKQFGEDVEYIDGILGEVVYRSSKRPKEPTAAEKASWYGQLKRYEHDRGYRSGWSAHKFREKFGVWPNAYKHVPAADDVSPEVQQYVKHLHIRRAKSAGGAANG